MNLRNTFWYHANGFLFLLNILSKVLMAMLYAIGFIVMAPFAVLGFAINALGRGYSWDDTHRYSELRKRTLKGRKNPYEKKHITDRRVL